MTGRFEVRPTKLAGVSVLVRTAVGDDRGWLERLYDAGDLAPLLGERRIVQVNRTLTRLRGTVRGMHYQVPPAAETKIVSCLRGAILDVALDVRRDSPTFLRWHAEVLDATERRSLLIPEGVAHGLQALEDDCEVLYLHTAAYDAATERGIHPQDARAGINWALPVAHLSARDTGHPQLQPGFEGVRL